MNSIFREHPLAERCRVGKVSLIAAFVPTQRPCAHNTQAQFFNAQREPQFCESKKRRAVAEPSNQPVAERLSSSAQFRRFACRVPLPPSAPDSDSTLDSILESILEWRRGVADVWVPRVRDRMDRMDRPVSRGESNPVFGVPILP